MHWQIGCSGYHYSEWKGLFYPLGLAKDKWFEFYAKHFRVIELNATFYKFPRVELLRGWYQKAPADFTFVVKAPRVITHFKKFKDAQKYINDFYQAVHKGLSEKLGAVLFQFPATFEFTDERLHRVLQLLDKSVTNVLEFRHASWWKEEIFEEVARNDVSFCGMSHPGLPDTLVKTSDTIYYRFHGVPHLYMSSYDAQALESFVNQCAVVPALTKVYAIFNNTMEGAAVVNARQMSQLSEVVQRY